MVVRKTTDEKIKAKAKTKTKVKSKAKAKVPVKEKAKAKEKSKERTPAQYDLVVVESPVKAKTIKKYLGKGYEVVASNGHIKDLPKSKLGVYVDKDFSTDMLLIPGKKNVLDKLYKYISMANHIYLATDPDREGEAIAFHIAEEISEKRAAKVHRVLFNAITKTAVKEAIAHPVELDSFKHDSQKARRILDRLVGYKISPILWEKVQRGLSAGRVQSVALRLIVEREEDIKKFVSEQWFSIEADLQKDGKIFRARYFGEDAQKKTDLFEESAARKILSDVKGKPFIVHEIKKRERRQSPTPPFTTSKLQQEAANKLGFSAKKTMILAQKLYEGVDLKDHGLTGLITYMRTDSVRTSPEALTEVRDYIEQRYGKENVAAEVVIYKKKGAGKVQDAHEAIRPASLEYPPELVKEALDGDEFKLYELIWNKFVSSQMCEAVIDQTMIMFNVKGHYFKANGSIVKFPGFRTVYLEAALEKALQKRGNNNDSDSDNEIDEGPELSRELPEVFEKEKITTYKEPESLEHWTSPPPRYNDASIVKDLEEKGIGRPSTYATIISNIVDRGYIEKIETRYMPTELGIVVCRLLVESFPTIMDVEFTAKVEDQLDEIEVGQVDFTKVLKEFWKPFEKALKKAKTDMADLKKTEIPTNVPCNKCADGHYMIKWGRNGQFFACSNYPECTSSEDFKKHLDGSYEIIPKQYTKDPCPNCGKRLIVKKGRYGRFVACEEYPHCKTTLPYMLDVHCPKCETGRFVEKKSRYGKMFYGCSNYPDCSNAMWNLPKQFACPSCNHPVMGLKENKKKGIHLYCQQCHHTVPIEETPFK